MDLATRLERARFRSKVLRAPSVRRRHRGLTDMDALLVSYPRSGTTWLRFLLSESLTGVSAEFAPDDAAIPYVGDHGPAAPILADGGRVIMSHETLALGPHRVIYIVRDPRAVALSEFRWLRRRALIDDDLEVFLRAFTRGRSNPWGSWAGHVQTWRRSASAQARRLCIVRYEDLRTDTEAQLSIVLSFLGASAEPDTIAESVRNNSLASMRDKEQRAPDTAFAKGVQRDVRFVAEGAVAGWRRELSPEQVASIEKAFGDTMIEVGYALTGDGHNGYP